MGMAYRERWRTEINFLPFLLVPPLQRLQTADEIDKRLWGVTYISLSHCYVPRPPHTQDYV